MDVFVVAENPDDAPLFPILRGESVGESGEFSGRVFIVCEPENLDREWSSDEIAVLDSVLKEFIHENPGALDRLFKNVSAVLSEFGEHIGQFSSSAYENDAICVVKIPDASHVLENDMHIRVIASENQGDVCLLHRLKSSRLYGTSPPRTTAFTERQNGEESLPKTRSYHILDWSEVRRMQFLILIGSALFFPLYAIVLMYYKAVLFGLLLLIVYVSTQIPVGLVLTYYFQILGTLTKRKLKLLDPSKLSADWVSSQQEMHSEDISRLFDDISIQLQKYDPSVDDVIDLTWFGVIVWAVISTGIAAVFNPPVLFYASSSLVLSGLCLASLYNGYRIAPSPSFDETMEHLKHLVLSRLSALHAVVGKRYFQPGVRLLSKGKKQVIDDLFVQILNKSRDKGAVLSYWLGLSSADNERLDFDVADEHVEAIQGSLMDLPIISDFGWTIDTESNSSESGVVLRNEQSALRIDVQSTMILSPSRIKESSEKLAGALKAVILTLDS
jgi:hypothetical protein